MRSDNLDTRTYQRLVFPVNAAKMPINRAIIGEIVLKLTFIRAAMQQYSQNE